MTETVDLQHLPLSVHSQMETYLLGCRHSHIHLLMNTHTCTFYMHSCEQTVSYIVDLSCFLYDVLLYPFSDEDKFNFQIDSHFSKEYNAHVLRVAGSFAKWQICQSSVTATSICHPHTLLTHLVHKDHVLKRKRMEASNM